MEEMKTYFEWQVIFGIRILDPDGWRGVNFKDLSKLLSRKEFIKRAKLSTVIGKVYNLSQ